VLARSGDKATIDLGAAGRMEAWTPQPLAAGDKEVAALRAENVRLRRLLDLTPEQAPAATQTGLFLDRPGPVTMTPSSGRTRCGSSPPCSPAAPTSTRRGGRTRGRAVRGWSPAAEGGWRIGMNRPICA